MENTYLFYIGGCCAVTTIYILGKKMWPSFKLDRRLSLMDKETDINLTSIPKSSLRIQNVDMRLRVLDSKVKEIVEEFIDTLSMFEHIDLTNFFLNLSPHIVIDPSIESFTYDISTMKICLSDKNLRENLLLALFYLAGTNNYYRLRSSGFVRQLDDVKLGYGLSRGYVEILGNRYFDFKGDTWNTDIIVGLAKAIEVLVGQEAMESMFFDGSLDGLVEKLSTFSSREEAIRTVREIDHLDVAFELGDLINITRSKSVYKDIVCQLAKMLSKKISLLSKDEISEIQFTFETQIDLLSSICNIGSNYYKISKKEVERQISLTKLELENRGFSAKIE